MQEAYKDSGRVSVSLSDFESTAYYPYSTSMSPTCHGGTLVVEAENKQVTSRLTGLPMLRFNFLYKRSFDPNQEPQVKEHWPLEYDSESLTQVRLTAYVAGVNAHLLTMLKVRDGIQDELRSDDGNLDVCFSHLGSKPIPICRIRADVPQDKGELSRYLTWLCQTENVQALDDGWKRLLRFSLVGGHILGRSDEPDGIAGTSDDIVVVSK